jgi:phosphatidylserine decarboxylase
MDEIWNRERNQLEEFRVYKGEAMIFIHKSPIARALMSKIATLPFFSILISLKDYTRFSKKKVLDFVAENNLDVKEFEKPASEYFSFSDFFVRRLKAEARPACVDENALVSPADGVLTVFPDLSEVPSFTIKGQKFTLKSLLRDSHLAEEFIEGSLAVIYLSPTDYHRYHFPCNCMLEGWKALGAKLFSVNPIAIEYGFRPFDVNVRVVNTLTNEKMGKFLMVEIGAIYVGRIIQTSHLPGKKVKGEEKGYFGLGGSSIILAFKKGAIRFEPDILEWALKSISSRVKTGQKIGNML